LTTTAARRESGGVAAVELNAAELSEDTLKGKYYDKKRIPAYTDRVLFRSLPGFVGNLRLQVCARRPPHSVPSPRSFIAITVHSHRSSPVLPQSRA